MFNTTLFFCFVLVFRFLFFFSVLFFTSQGKTPLGIKEMFLADTMASAYA